MTKVPTTKFDLSQVDKSKGVNVNYQFIGPFIVATVSEEGVADRALGFEIGHYSEFDQVSFLSKFMKVISSSVRHTSKHFKERI